MRWGCATRERERCALRIIRKTHRTDGVASITWEVILIFRMGIHGIGKNGISVRMTTVQGVFGFQIT